jgi:hypothetical protein
MRSRPDLKVYLTPSSPLPGTLFRAEAELVSHSKTPIDGVEFHLIGTERRHSGTSTVGSTTVPVYQMITHVDLIGSTPATTLDKGVHRVAAEFEVPPRCPPAYRSAITEIRYDLMVRVSIPWWPDRSERYLVDVKALPSRAAGAPGSYCTDSAGPQGKSLYIEASLDSVVIDHHGSVRGAVSFANVSHNRVRRIELALVVDERPAERSGIRHEALRYLVTLREGAPVEGESMSFNIKIPEKSPVSFVGVLVDVRWHLEIRAVIALGADVTLSIPIEVVRRGADAPVDSARLRRAPPIGRERRALVWAEGARKRGFVNDVDEERMTLDLGDGAALGITLEQRKEGGLFYDATITWPRLGLDLGVTERRWVDAWSGAKIPIDVPRFGERFTVRGREAAQVLAFLDEAAARALLGFDEAAIGDEGATLVCAGTAQSVDDLDAFLGRALAAAQMLARGLARIPPPASMAAFVPAWRAFAGALGGRVSLGEMAIVDAAFDRAPIQISTTWTEKGEPRSTELRLPVTLREGATQSDTNLDPASLALVASLKAQTTALVITSDMIVATVPAPLADPASIEPVLIGLSRLALSISGASTRGPYR